MCDCLGQIYREVIEAAQDTTRGRGDNEEIYLEEEERRWGSWRRNSYTATRQQLRPMGDIGNTLVGGTAPWRYEHSAP